MLVTQRMMVQEIANVLKDLPPTLSPATFSQPWRKAYQAILDAGNGDRDRALVAALSDRADCEHLIGIIHRAEPGAQITMFPSLGAIADDLQPIEWLWHNWIPRAMLSMLTASPGAGKSLMSLDVCNRIIEGTTWPNGLDIPHAGANVIYVDAECVPVILNERAESWEMNKDRLFIMLPDEDRLIIDLSDQYDQDRLIEMAHQVGPELIVIDSLSTISSRGENNIEDVRNILSFLNQVAGAFNCGMLLIHHLRKRSLPMLDSIVTLDDLRGSSHIGAMARSVLALSIIQNGPEFDRNGPRRLDLIKTNLAAYPDPIGVYLEPLHPDGVILRYDATAPKPYKEPCEYEKCAAWMIETLENEGEPIKPKDFAEMAESAGFSRATFYRAKKHLGEEIVSTGGHKDPTARWGLPEQIEELADDDEL